MKTDILRNGLLVVLMFFGLQLNAQTNWLPVSGGELVEHSHYTLRYSEMHEQAIWVAYTLTHEMVNGDAKRKDDFRQDPEVDTQSAALSDYEGAGYDRGHLCPAADMNFTSEAMSETFYMSNMSPQEPSFNRGIWKKLEAVVRNWASEKGNIYVVTGPVFRDNIDKIGENEVTVPGYYYKVIYDPVAEKMISLVLPNEKSSVSLQHFVCTVDSVETITGIDFFAEMEDDKEDRLEANVNAADWTFVPFKAGQKTPSSSAIEAQSNARCQAITSSGKQCSRKAEPGSSFCWQHQKKN